MTPEQTRRRHVLNVATVDHRFQFGQPAGTRKTVPESMGCGPNAIQIIAHAWGQPLVTMDDVLVAAGSPRIQVNDGLLTHQCTDALRGLKLPYEGVYNVDPDDLMRIMKQRGPVLFLCEYLYWPQWNGYHVAGDTATGIPNGYARPIGHAGGNDLRFTGGHYGVGLSSLYRRQKHRSDIWLRDPDHDSGLRPETPRFDVVTDGQWRELFHSAANFTHDGSTYAAIPTRSI